MISPTTEELEFIRACRIDTQEERFLEQCSIYGDFLYETNETMNLTRIPPEEFWTKHICDSLSLAMRWEMPRDGHHVKMCDVGCGAGLPSLILAAAFPGLFVTAVDSTGKKVNFVASAANALGLKNLHTVHGRAVELNRRKEFQNRFDIITARAVAPAPSIYRETSRFAKRDGRWIFYKTPGQSAEELPELTANCRDMQWFSSDEITLPGDAGTRVFISGSRK